VAQLVDVLNGGLRETQDRLDAVANALARAVNAVHATGVDATGASAGPLFVDRASDTYDPAGDPFRAPMPLPGTVTARSIGVRLAVQQDPRLLAATSDAARPTDNDVALALAALRTGASVTVANGGAPVTVRVELWLRGQSAAAPTLGLTLGEHYRAAATTLGVQVRDATNEAAVRRTLADQLDARRAATSGVNLDEELTTMMRAQQAYAAAAKVVTAADEMMQALLAMI
jgi:flagellar hook-associated protein 1 FlgK